jgi:hypothetical protein
VARDAPCELFRLIAHAYQRFLDAQLVCCGYTNYKQLSL